MIDYAIDESNRLIACRVGGTLGFIEVSRALQRLLEDSMGRRDYDVLVVIEDIEAYLSCTKMGSLLPLLSLWHQTPRRGREALVLPNHTALTLVTLALSDPVHSLRSLHCSLSELEAINWLKVHPTGGSMLEPRLTLVDPTDANGRREMPVAIPRETHA